MLKHIMTPEEVATLTNAATIVIAVAAVYALGVAVRQVAAAKENTKANFLMDLDTRWEGADMRAARAKWGEIHEGVLDFVGSQHPGADAAERKSLIRSKCAEDVQHMYENDFESYSEILKIIGFFETLGYMADRGFISVEEIADLYGESIIGFDDLFRDHLNFRIDVANREMDGKSKLFAHTMKLISDTYQFYGLSNR
jgi:hypothetical protein